MPAPHIQIQTGPSPASPPKERADRLRFDQPCYWPRQIGLAFVIRCDLDGLRDHETRCRERMKSSVISGIWSG